MVEIIVNMIVCLMATTGGVFLGMISYHELRSKHKTRRRSVKTKEIVDLPEGMGDRPFSTPSPRKRSKNVNAEMNAIKKDLDLKKAWDVSRETNE